MLMAGPVKGDQHVLSTVELSRRSSKQDALKSFFSKQSYVNLYLDEEEAFDFLLEVMLRVPNFPASLSLSSKLENMFVWFHLLCLHVKNQ